MKFTKHGKHRIAERGISEKQILQAISKPAFAFYDLSSAANVVFKRLNGKHLLVVYASEGNEVRIITTFITSTAQEIIENKLETGIMGENQMEVEYDRKADILYIKIKEAKIVDTRMLDQDVYADVDKDNNFVGIEIWQATKNAIQPLSRTLAQEVKTTLQKVA